MNIDEYRALRDADQSQTGGGEPNAQVEQGTVANTEPTNQATEQTGEVSADAGTEGATPTQQEQTTQTIPEFIEIDGQEVPVEELKNGYLRQSDYTRKTQELAVQSRQAELAQQYYDALQTNPELAQKIAETFQLPYVDKQTLQAQEYEDKYHEAQLKLEIRDLQDKYEDFDPHQVLQYAYDNRIEDLENAYLLNRAHTQKDPAPVDVETLKEQIRQQVLAELQSNVDTQSIISTGGDSGTVQDTTPTLSAEEQKVARNLKMTPEEYMKWRSH